MLIPIIGDGVGLEVSEGFPSTGEGYVKSISLLKTYPLESNSVPDSILKTLVPNYFPFWIYYLSLVYVLLEYSYLV